MCWLPPILHIHLYQAFLEVPLPPQKLVLPASRWMQHNEVGRIGNSKELLHQHATATSDSDWLMSESASKGFFWNWFLSWPQAAFASRPLVWRTLTVILWDSRAATNAITWKQKKRLWISEDKIYLLYETLARLLKTYGFLVWTLILRPFYGIERYQVHVITPPHSWRSFASSTACSTASLTPAVHMISNRKIGGKQFVRCMMPESTMRNIMKEETRIVLLMWCQYLKAHTQRILSD